MSWLWWYLAGLFTPLALLIVFIVLAYLTGNATITRTVTRGGHQKTRQWSR